MTDTTMNLEAKGTLAKLLATENLTVQHNKVSTASFDIENRILTLPIFKEQSPDVTDMLIAHECSHALWTPWGEWSELTDEVRSYVNVLEDTRIDRMIQAKYPGVVKNYVNGFNILENRNFFGTKGKDINEDLMLIDKINLRSKSLNRLPFKFSDEENEWLEKVDSIVTFEDVISLAKEMIDWQKEQLEDMSQLPNFDNLVANYDLDDGDYDDEIDSQDSTNDFESQSGQASGEEQETDEQDGYQTGYDSGESDSFESENQTTGSKGDGDFTLKSITDKSYEDNKESLVDDQVRGYNYGGLPIINLRNIVPFKGFIKAMKEYRHYRIVNNYNRQVPQYEQWLANHYKKFIKDNKKTVMYLVKEFEMKKSATAYKRASTDKTGVIDPLKLKDYKFSDDIFKRMTIIPDGKNHGMIMLLDWSGSMVDNIMDTVDQLLNLTEFCRKVNIPFEVYFFTSQTLPNAGPILQAKTGSFRFGKLGLVNCLSHRMTKKEYEEASKFMMHMAISYGVRYSRISNSEYWSTARWQNWGVPDGLELGNTPLNEALVVMTKLIPLWKEKYDIEKLTFVTLTDGSANSFENRVQLPEGQSYEMETLRKNPVFKLDKKTQVAIQLDGMNRLSDNVTAMFLDYFRNKYDANVIGFYILNRVRKWDIERYCEGDYFEREQQYKVKRKEMTKNNAIAVEEPGYNKYFLLDGKKLQIENTDISDLEVKKETVGEFKKIFGKAMKSRLVSRVILNKFIEEVA